MRLSFGCFRFAGVALQIALFFPGPATLPGKFHKALDVIFKSAAGMLLILLTAQKTPAQVDSNYVDTISLRHTDTAANAKPGEAPVGYDDQDDGYVDTTIKHIYDTSQYFFNWKNYYSDTFIDKKITQRHLLDAEVDALKKDGDFWYIPAIEKLETRLRDDPAFKDSLLKASALQLSDERENSILYQPWFSILFWVIVIGIFAAAVIYFLAQNKISIFSKNAASSVDEAHEDEHEDIFTLPYTKLIRQADKEKNYRVAIRLMFLQTLKLLSDINAIQYQPDYTNLVYLQQLQASKYYNDFFEVMRSYEYVWYGKFPITGEQYETIKNNFLRLQHTIM